MTKLDTVQRVCQAMPMNTYPDAATDVIGAIKAERRRTLDILARYTEQMDAAGWVKTVALLKRVAGEVEGT